jgi:hypothetical protein
MREIEVGLSSSEHSATSRYGARCPCGTPARWYLASWPDGTPWYTCRRATPGERSDLLAWVAALYDQQPDLEQAIAEVDADLHADPGL